jgi:hypothetical protein
MKYVFFETPAFSRLLPSYLTTQSTDYCKGEDQIWLFTMYDKDEIDDLTVKQCRTLKHAIQEELRARRGSA